MTLHLKSVSIQGHVEPIIVTNTAGSLGDWLSLTPLLRNLIEPKVLAKDSPHSRAFAALYEGLAPVEFTKDDLPNVPETGTGPFSRRVMNAFNQVGNAIPSIVLRADEIAWARDFLKQYENPVAFNNTCGGAQPDKPINDISNWRRMPEEVVKHIVKDLRARGKTILRFGTKASFAIYNNYDEFEGVINLPDMPLRQVAACYQVIGEYWGTDTGDHHLMLAVGGISHCFVPPSVWHYQHERHLYQGDAWGTQEVRERYYQFNKVDITPQP